jgi:hypothetical protein
LDSTDERLLSYLDDDGEPAVVQRLRFYTTAMLEGSITPIDVADDRPDWFDLAPALVPAYGTEELNESERGGVPASRRRR